MGDVRPHSKRRVCYYYDEDIGTFYYGSGHPMKPQRIRMAHHLIFNYKLHRQMEILRPMKAPKKELLRFHTHDYLNFLKNGDKLNDSTYERNRGEFGIGPDCPLFKGVFEFSQLAAGGSLAGAVRLNRKMSDIAINWSGGLHHAKKSEAAGFCYVNDIVLAILELLKYHERVLYVDIDIHHGDGVEEAFYTTNRVMTVSFHKFGEFFPGTGTTNEIGAGKGKYYSVNFPLRDGMDDESYQQIFEPVMERVMDMYRPGAIVLECGADSLAGDRLGRFNLTIEGHSKCVAFMMKYNVPLLLLGGGGYTPVNVARCWTKETAVALGCSVEDNMPYHDYFERYLPDFKLSIRPLELLTNNNSREYLSGVKCRLLENLRNLEHAPGAYLRFAGRGEETYIDKAVITQVEVINNATLSNMNDEKEELNSNGKEFPEIPETEETKGVNPKKNLSNEQISINNTEKEVENGTNVVVDKDEIALDGEGEEIASDISKDPDEMQQNGYCEKQHEKPIKLEECADQPLSTKVESQIKIDIEECHTESRTSSPKQKVTSDNDQRDEINLDGNNGGERNHKKKKVSSKLNREKEQNEEQDDQTIEDEKKEKKVDSQIKIDIEESCGKQRKKQTKQKQQNNQPKVDRIKSGEVIAKKYLNENKKGNCTVQKDIPVMLAKEVSQRDSKKCTGKNLETLNLPITAFLNTDLEIGDFENDANKKKKSDLRQKGSSEMIQKNNTPQTVSKANDTCKQVSKYISQVKQQTKPQKHATNHNSTERNSKIAGMMKNNHVFKCDSKVKKNDYGRAGILTKGRERRLYELEMVYKGTKRGDYKKMIMKHRKPPVKKRPPKREPKNIIIGTVDMGPGVQFYRTMEKSLLTS